MRVRGDLVAVIYQKALVLSNDERGKGTGDIVNLMSVDASRLQDLCAYGLVVISENIGPVGEYQDAEIWEALNQVSLHFQRCK
jgi:hypothetical protein